MFRRAKEVKPLAYLLLLNTRGDGAMRESSRALITLIVMVIGSGLVYVACAIWPFNLGSETGCMAGSLAAFGILLLYLLGLVRRLGAMSE